MRKRKKKATQNPNQTRKWQLNKKNFEFIEIRKLGTSMTLVLAKKRTFWRFFKILKSLPAHYLPCTNRSNEKLTCNINEKFERSISVSYREAIIRRF